MRINALSNIVRNTVRADCSGSTGARALATSPNGEASATFCYYDYCLSFNFCLSLSCSRPIWRCLAAVSGNPQHTMQFVHSVQARIHTIWIHIVCARRIRAVRTHTEHTERALGRNEMESDDYAWWSACSVRWCGKFIFTAVLLL